MAFCVPRFQRLAAKQPVAGAANSEDEPRPGLPSETPRGDGSTTIELDRAATEKLRTVIGQRLDETAPVVNELLEAPSMDEPKAEILCAPFDLRACVNEVVALVQPTAMSTVRSLFCSFTARVRLLSASARTET